MEDIENIRKRGHFFFSLSIIFGVQCFVSYIIWSIYSNLMFESLSNNHLSLEEKNALKESINNTFLRFIPLLFLVISIAFVILGIICVVDSKNRKKLLDSTVQS